MKKKDMILAALGIASVSIFLLLVLDKKDNKHPAPPKGAPQLDIKNPGNQDEFPNAPLESEIG